jgi:hypothetical protein
MTRNARACAAALLAVVVALLLVGVISGTLLRHAVQVVPLLAAMLAVTLRPAWGRFAALPVLLFWLLLMLLVWLYLLGWQSFFTGTFSPVEVGLTVVIGLACAVGVAAAARDSTGPAWWAGVAAFVLFGGLQVAAMWLSFQPAIANR